jgi:hypothetical protein
MRLSPGLPYNPILNAHKAEIKIAAKARRNQKGGKYKNV